MARGGTRNGRGLRLACVAMRTPNGYYRALVPLKEMARRGHVVQWPDDRTFLRLRDGEVPPWDAVHFQHMYDDECLEIMACARKRGIAVVWDTDDDIGAVTRGTRAWRQMGGRRGIRQFRQRQPIGPADLFAQHGFHDAQISCPSLSLKAQLANMGAAVDCTAAYLPGAGAFSPAGTMPLLRRCHQKEQS